MNIYDVYLSPDLSIEIEADSAHSNGNAYEFWRDGAIVAQFTVANTIGYTLSVENFSGENQESGTEAG